MLVKDFNRTKMKGGKLDNEWRGPCTITKCLGRRLHSLKVADNSHEITRIGNVHLKY